MCPLMMPLMRTAVRKVCTSCSLAFACVTTCTVAICMHDYQKLHSLVLIYKHSIGNSRTGSQIHRPRLMF